MYTMRIKGENLKLKVEGLIVNYDDNGPDDAPVIIFIHGFPFNKSMWSHQLELLKGSYRVIAYDVRGHGSSSDTHGSLSIDLFTKDLLDFIDHLNLHKVTLCGLSLGGYIALNAIEKHPSKFEALILCGTQCIADDQKTKEARREKSELVRLKGIEYYADESLRNLFAARSFTARKEEVRAVRNMIIQNSSDFISNGLRALAERKETCSSLSKIKVPVLILVGKEDKITPLSEAEYLHINIKGSEMHVISYAAHLANLENTHEFNEHIKKFIAKTIPLKEPGKYLV